MKTDTPIQATSDPLETRVEVSRRAWRRLEMTVRSIAPQALGPALLVIAALADKWEVESVQMEIARSLAGNTRAVVQVGHGSDISRFFLLGGTLTDNQAEQVQTADGPPAKKPLGRAARSTS